MLDIKTRIEELIDTSDSPEIDVIIQMGRGNDPLNRFIDIASATLKRRSLVTSARELLPVELESLEHSRGEKISPRWRRTLYEREASLVAQAALRHSTRGRATQPLTYQASEKSLRPLLNSAVIRNQQKTRRRFTEPARLWMAESLVLTLHKDALRRLAEEVENVAGVYRNRRLALPNYSEVAQVPVRVSEKHSAAWGIERIGAPAAWGALGARGRGISEGHAAGKHADSPAPSS